MLKKCPTCGRPVDFQNNPARPFCSERCQLIDFGRWADEEYSVPAEETAPLSEETGEIQDSSDNNARGGDAPHRASDFSAH